MKKLKKVYTFGLQTRNVGDALLKVCSFSLFSDIPLEFIKIVIMGSEQDYISFRLLMNKPTKDMMVRIFFQLPAVTEVRIFNSGRWRILEYPFSLYVDYNGNDNRKYEQGLN